MGVRKWLGLCSSHLRALANSSFGFDERSQAKVQMVWVCSLLEGIDL